MAYEVHVAGIERLNVAITITLIAELAELPLTLKSEQRSVGDRLTEIKKGLDNLEAWGKSAEGHSVEPRGAQISISDRSKISGGGHTSAGVVIRRRLSATADDIYSAARYFQGVIESLPTFGKLSYELGPVRLGIVSPEAHRKDIVARIVKYSNELRSECGREAAIEVQGLESPILVWQVSRREVGLGIPYKLSLRS
jgi:hypothetical protein